MGAPERADDDLVFIERVVEMAGDFRHVDAPKSGNACLWIRSASTRQECQDPESLFKLGYEDFRMNPIFQPPLFFVLDMSAGRCRESDPTGGQRERSSRRISSASTSRSADTSAFESRRAW